MVEDVVFQLELDDASLMHLALRAYDLVHYDGLTCAQSYVDLVVATASEDRASWNYEATRAVLKNAFKVMAIKDEIYVAHLLTSPEKRQRDRVRFNIDPANGDRLTYRHINRPEFVVFGRRFR